MNPLEQLKSVICDPDGKCCITGSDEDRAIVDRALQALAPTSTQCEVQPEQEPVAWKPIKTAPKDVMVLVCLPRQMNLVVRAWYNRIHNFWQTDYEGEGGITRPSYFHEGDLWHPIPPLYTTPPKEQRSCDKRPWVGLTHEQTKECVRAWDGNDAYYLCRAIESKLEEKNT